MHEGGRSNLFFEFARVVDAVRPGWVLVENVPGLLSSNGGRDFGVVLGTLADVGYGVAWRVLDSRFFGVPQRRRRVFILATQSHGDPRGAAERAGEILAVGTRCKRHPATSTEAGEDVAGASDVGFALRRDPGGVGQGHNTNYVAGTLGGYRGFTGDDIDRGGALVAATLSSGSHPGSNMPGRRKEDDVNLVTAFSHTQGLDAQPSGDDWPTLRRNGGGMGVGVGVGVRRLTPTECERLQALPDGWTDFGPDSRRYSALGDAVTSSVAEWIGRRLIRAARVMDGLPPDEESPANGGSCNFPTETAG
jgi:DNA (cytosine-5)-methyltransferase 1